MATETATWHEKSECEVEGCASRYFSGSPFFSSVLYCGKWYRIQGVGSQFRHLYDCSEFGVE